MASTIRGTVNDTIFATVIERLGPVGVALLQRLLENDAAGRQETPRTLS